MLLILAFASDLTRVRFPFIALGFLLTFIGFIIFVTIDVTTQIHVAYFSCFMMTWGTSAPSVILDVWYNNNIADENRRVMLTSVGVPVANLMGVGKPCCFLRNIYSIAWGCDAVSVIMCFFPRNPVHSPDSKRKHISGRSTPPALLLYIPNHPDTCLLKTIVSSNIFQDKDAPKYIPALATTAAFGGFGCLLTLVLGAWMMADNMRRDVRQGRKVHAKDIPTELLRDGPAADDYRWFL